MVVEAIPVRRAGRVIAVVSRHGARPAGHRPGPLEDTYLEIARQLERMLAIRSRFPDARLSFANSAGIFLGEGYRGDLARPGIAPYTATKGAVRNLTRGMATDWARHGLQVNAIAPGYFRTPLNQALVDDPDFSAWLAKRTPAGRWGEVGELVGAAVFLASDAASFVNGHTLFVDGGITASL